MKYAFIENGIAQEVVQSNPFMLFVEGYAAKFIEVPDVVFQGWRLVDGDWLEPLPPPVYVPQSVSIYQGKAAMLQLNLLDDVDAYMIRPSTPALTKLAWREATRFERSSAMIAQAKADLGWSDEQVDQLFILADTIR